MNCVEAEIDITILEGGTFDKIYQWKTGDPAVAVDLTGFTAEMQIRSKVKSTTSLLTVNSQSSVWEADAASGIYFSDGVAVPDDLGKYRIYIKDEDTLGLCLTNKDIEGAYDLFLYNADGEAVLKHYGIATIKAAVTRNV